MEFPNELYFVRHGESVANLLREFSNSGYKHPLTEKGIQQAHALAQNLSRLSIEQIYSSPIMRTVQTAQILSDCLHIPVQITEALREWSVGIYEGTSDPAGWEWHHRVQDLWFNQHQLDSKMPDGESFLEIQARFVPFIEERLAEGKDTHRSIVLIGHGALYAAMLPVIFRNVDHVFAMQHGFPNTGYALAETHPEGLYCISWCGMQL
jgi:broad specificity phosphatase PhoE